jgi:SulP family sulfate permease
MTVVMAAVFTLYTTMFPDDPAHGAALAFTVVMLGGGMQILFGVLRFGKFIELVPVPVVSGFMSGVGVIIILLQLPPLLGFPAQPGPMASAGVVPLAWQQLNAEALLLGLISLVVVYFLPRPIARLIPSPLVALIFGTLIAALIFGPGSVPILGEIPSGLPSLQLPAIDLVLLPEMFVSALTLAALGSIDSLLTSLVADNVTRTYHQSDRELIGQGIGNTVAGILGGLPGAGATMRTVVNVKAGGRTPISGALHALVLLAIILGAGGLAREIPHAVLAGILIKVGTDIIDWDFLRRVRHTPGTGVFIMLVVLLMTVFVDLIKAVAVGMAIAGVVFMKRMSDLQLASINVYRDVDESTPMGGEERAILNASGGRILLFHFGSPMSFGAAKGMARQLSLVSDYEVLVLDLSDVPMIDYTATRSLLDMVGHSREAGRKVILVGGGHPKVMKMIANQGVVAEAARTCDDCLQSNRLNGLRRAAALLDEAGNV